MPKAYIVIAVPLWFPLAACKAMVEGSGGSLAQSDPSISPTTSKIVVVSTAASAISVSWESAKDDVSSDSELQYEVRLIIFMFLQAMEQTHT